MTSPAPTPVPDPVRQYMRWYLSSSPSYLLSNSGPVDVPLSIATAWLIVEKLRSEGWILSLRDCHPDSRWFASFTKSPQQDAVEYGDSAPDAICAAAAAALASAGAAAGRAKGDSHD